MYIRNTKKVMLYLCATLLSGYKLYDYFIRIKNNRKEVLSVNVLSVKDYV